MAVFTTEGIIVRRRNFGEADRLLTVITPFKGKITVIAKGVRRITSRRGGNVELLNKVRLHIFQGQGMPILTEAESIETFPKIKSDLILSTYASHVVELSERMLPEMQPNPAAYNLLVTILTLLEKNPRQIFIRAFEVKFLTVMGFWDLGGVGPTSPRLRGTGEILEKLQKESWEQIGEMEIKKEEALELERVLRYYIEKVLESPLKSVKILEKLKVKG